MILFLFSYILYNYLYNYKRYNYRRGAQHMKTKIKNLGLGLISLLIFQIALSLVSIKTSINFLELKNYTGSSSISSPQLITDIITSSLIIISILVFAFKSKAGIILYIVSIITSLILSALFSSLSLEDFLVSLIFPGLTLLLVYIKRKTILNL